MEIGCGRSVSNRETLSFIVKYGDVLHLVASCLSSSGVEVLDSRSRNEQISKLVGLIGQLGPNINEVAHRLGVFRETARYRYKNLLRRGFTIHAMPDYSRLGFQRLIAIAGFSRPFRMHAKSILTLMHELCYVKRFDETAVEGWYVIQSAVPDELVESCEDVFKELLSLGMFSHLEVFKFPFARTRAMMTDYYDFEQEAWYYDWSLPRCKVPSLHVRDDQKARYDKVDLMIVSELQSDGTSNISKISKRIGMRYRKLVWHYANHVVGNGLIDGYAVNWTSTRRERGRDTISGGPRKYLPLYLLLSDADEQTKLGLMGLLQSLPFLWFEASGDHYFASVYLPPDSIDDFLSNLRNLEIDSHQLRYFLIGRSQSDFGLPYRSFDESTKKWRMDRDEVIRRFEMVFSNQREP